MLSRTTNRVASSMRELSMFSSRTIRWMVRTAIRPMSAKGWRTVVRGGDDQRASGRSSNQTTLTSSGTRSPRCRSASYTPRAIWSLETNTAVGGSFPSNSFRPARKPDS